MPNMESDRKSLGLHRNKAEELTSKDRLQKKVNHLSFKTVFHLELSKKTTWEKPQNHPASRPSVRGNCR